MKKLIGKFLYCAGFMIGYTKGLLASFVWEKKEKKKLTNYCTADVQITDEMCRACNARQELEKEPWK